MSEKYFPANATQFPVGLSSNSPWEFCSFEPLTYIYFNVAFIIIAYPLYRIVGGFFHWELDVKTPSAHFSDMVALVRYDFIVFVLGGYVKTFNWIMILSFYVAMFGYALLAELPFAKQSLPTWRNWAQKMWILFIVAVCAVLAMTGFHIYFVINLMNEPKYKNGVYIAWYLGCLVIPPILMLLAFIAEQEQNTRFLTRCCLKVIRIFKKNPDKPPPLINENELGTEAENQQQTTSGQPQPYDKVARNHLHHWQIFYVFAFFTRFDHPVSQIAGGISLGIYTQGIGAYGPDNYLEETLRN